MSRITTPQGFLSVARKVDNPVVAAQEVGAAMFSDKEFDSSLEGIPIDQPCDDWHIAQYIPPGRTAAGLVIPETAKNETPELLIIASGPGRLQDDGKHRAMKAKPGDRVRFWGHFLEYNREKRLVWMKDEFVVGIVANPGS